VWASSFLDQAYPLISSGYSWLRSVAPLLSCWWSCCLFRCWLGGLSSHSSFYIYAMAYSWVTIWFPGPPSGSTWSPAPVLKLSIVLLWMLLLRPPGYGSFLRNSILHYGGLHLCTITMWVPAISRQIRCNINELNTSRLTCTLSMTKLLLEPSVFFMSLLLHRYFHQEPPIYGFHRISYQPERLSAWLIDDVQSANWWRSECGGVLDL
jgi:hypothetical protein